MDRRTLLKGITALATGLVLPPTLAENAEAARRFWALDQTMTYRWLKMRDFARWCEAYEKRDGAWVDALVPESFYGVRVGERLPIQTFSGHIDTYLITAIHPTPTYTLKGH